MARLPEVADLDRYVADGRQAPVGFDTSQVGAGTMALGRAMEQAAQRAEERRNKIEIAKADADFNILKAHQDRAFDKDDEFETIVPRWQDSMSKGMDEVLSGVTDPYIRNQLQERYRSAIGVGSAAMGAKAWDREVSVQLGTMDEKINQVYDASLKGDDANFMAGFQTIENYINASIDAGYIDDIKADEFKRKWREKLTLGRLKMYAPEERLAKLPALEKHLPADTYAALKREAHQANNEAFAIRMADKLVDDPEMTREQAAAELQKIKDPKRRKAAEDRYYVEMARKEKADHEQQQMILDKYMEQFADGMTMEKLKEIDSEAHRKMGPTVRASFLRMEAAAAKGVKPQWRIEVHDHLKLLKGRYEKGDTSAWDEGKVWYVANKGNLEKSQAEAWSAFVIDPLMQGPAGSALSNKDYIVGRLPKKATAWDKSRAAIEWDEYERNYQDMNNGQMPPAKDREVWFDTALESKGWFGSSLWEMEDGDWNDVAEELMKEDKDVFDTVTAFYTAKGIEPGKVGFVKRYRALAGRIPTLPTPTQVEQEVPVAPVEQEVPVAPVEQEVPVAPVEQEVPVAPVEQGDGTMISAQYQNMNEADKRAVLERMKAENPDVYEQIMYEFKDAGIKASPYQIMVTYESWIEPEVLSPDQVKIQDPEGYRKTMIKIMSRGQDPRDVDTFNYWYEKLNAGTQ